MQVANIFPNRISVYNARNTSYSEMCEKFISTYGKLDKQKFSKSLENLTKKKSTLELSRNSKNQLLQSMSCLVAYSKPRTIFRKNRKPIYNYRASFVTLTLPSPQIESDVEIKQCLNLFFTDLRRVYKLTNYVWRSEIQKNGNIHFHIGIDKYIDFNVLKNYWLKSLRNTTQVRRYTQKFSSMSYKEYRELRINHSLANDQKKTIISEESIKKAYVYGCRTNWLSPPVLDVRSIQNVNMVASYVSKYMSKSAKCELSQERIENFGKVWSRSTSLVKIKFRFPIVYEDVKEFIQELIQTKSVFTKVYDYSTVHYFKFSEMPKKLKSRIYRSLIDVGKTFAYPFPDLKPTA